MPLVAASFSLGLDEATSHLDVQLEQRINDTIKQPHMTRIIIAHRPETIASADRVIVLGHGPQASSSPERVMLGYTNGR